MSSSSLSPLPSLVVWHQTRLGTQSKSQRSKREGERKTSSNNKAIISSSGWHLYRSRPPPHPVPILPLHVTSFVRLPFSSIFGLDSWDCLLSRWLSPSISSARFFCFPWSVSLSISFFPPPPLPSRFLFHPSFCLFASLNLAFNSSSFGLIFFPAPPDSLVFSLVLAFFWPLSFPQSLTVCLSFLPLLPSFQCSYPKHENMNLVCSLFPLQHNVRWHMYWVLTLSLFLWFVCLWCELTRVLTQKFNT